MKYAIDVVGLDQEGVVVSVRTVPPWRFGPWRWRTYSTLELASGEAARLGLVVGVKPMLIEQAREGVS